LRAFSQLIRWQDVFISTIQNSQKIVKKGQKGTINESNMDADVVVSAGITEHIRGLSQLIRWQDVIKLVYDRTYLTEVLQNMTRPDLTRNNRPVLDQT